MLPTGDERAETERFAAEHREGFLQAITAAAEQLGGFLQEAELDARGLNPGDPGILVIPGLGAPAFQFDGNSLRLVAAEINTLLLAQEDPYGVADWWLLANNYLEGDIPANLIGKGEFFEQQLRGIANAELP